MRPDRDVHEAFRLHTSGLTKAEIARRVGIAHVTVRDWLAAGEAAVLARPMRRARASHLRAAAHHLEVERCPVTTRLDEPAFAYLLGQYLGDGCVSRIGRSFRVRIYCCDDYPNIMGETAQAIRSTIPGSSVGHIQRAGCTEVYATSLHWPCLLPTGAGVKHLRPILLAGWKREIAIERHPGQLLRGLIHSDGCRCINPVRRRGRVYEYPRYLFTNKSTDIQEIFLEACVSLGVDARRNNTWSISVARREAVRKLDTIIGPKS